MTKHKTTTQQQQHAVSRLSRREILLIALLRRRRKRRLSRQRQTRRGSKAGRIWVKLRLPVGALMALHFRLNCSALSSGDEQDIGPALIDSTGFRRQFRVPRSVFMKVLRGIHHLLDSGKCDRALPCRRNVSPREALAMSLTWNKR